LHALAACSNTGELVSIDFGIARKYPPLPTTALLPAGFDAGEVLGSGKPEIPCSRIHADTSSIRACACEDGGSEFADPFGSRRWQECRADWNAGDSMVLCEPIRTVWPVTFGSEKFGTPCERMHLENATPDSTALAADAAVLAPPVALVELPPHPASSTALRRAAAVSGRARRRGEPLGLDPGRGGIRFSFEVFLAGIASSSGPVLRGRLFRHCFALRGRQRSCLTEPAKQR
jgi:hypothetical protein